MLINLQITINNWNTYTYIYTHPHMGLRSNPQRFNEECGCWKCEICYVCTFELLHTHIYTGPIYLRVRAWIINIYGRLHRSYLYIIIILSSTLVTMPMFFFILFSTCEYHDVMYNIIYAAVLSRRIRYFTCVRSSEILFNTRARNNIRIYEIMFCF